MNRLQGFTLIEVLIAVFLLAVAAIAFTGLLVLSTRISLESERQTVAQGIVNEELEYIRSLNYDSVGITLPPQGELYGVLEPTATVTRNAQTYNVERHVFYGDDVGNGVNPVPNTLNADYKRVTIKATWTSAGGQIRDVEAGTVITNSINITTCTPGLSSCPYNAVCPSTGICARDAVVSTCPLGAKFCEISAPAP